MNKRYCWDWYNLEYSSLSFPGRCLPISVFKRLVVLLLVNLDTWEKRWEYKQATKIKRIDSKVSLIGVKWFLYINFFLEIDLLCHNRIEMHECKVIYAQEINTTDLNALEIKFIAFLSNKCNENVVGIFCITHIVLKISYILFRVTAW